MADSETNTGNLKKRIAYLLGLLCLATVLLYVNFVPDTKIQLRDPGQIDSLITQTFDQFNIPSNQIRKRDVPIDTVMTRSVYTVDLPAEFPKTQWHYELNKRVRPFGMDTPARVIFPEKDIRIHLVYNSNIIRSVILQTDPDLVLYYEFASILLAFDNPPSQSELNQIVSLGEPVSIVFRSTSPRQDYEVVREFRRIYPRTLWWLQAEDGINASEAETMDIYLGHLTRLEQVDPRSRVLFINPYESGLPESVGNRLGSFDLSITDTGQALYLDNLDNEAAVNTITRQLLDRSSVLNPPTLIIDGTNENISLLQDYISELKQLNFQLRNPPASRF